MYNRKVLIDALKKLGSAKVPTQQKDMIMDPMGQWAHPGKNTRIPLSDFSDRITMKGVNYPVLGIANTGQKQMMQPGQEYNFPGADYVDEYPQMRNGGLPRKKNSKAYSRSLDATNRLFAKHPWFAKPKSRKNKIYDPNAKYYANGGESGCPEGYAFNPKTGECIEWNPTVWNTEDQSTSFDPIADIIYMNPNDRPEGMSDEEYNQMYQDQIEHEQLHRLQWLNDELQGESKIPLRMPSPVDNQDYNGPHYYNRRQEEVDYLHDYWKNMHPQDAEFIPDDIIYNNETDPAMYQLPWTVEGEARDYEYATRDGMQSLFPKRQKGGQLKKAQFGLAGTGEDRSLSFTPFDFRSSYGQTSDFNRNPNYSLTYNTPKLFKKADLAGNPLSITLGRPYNTDAESLTNRTLNFMPQEGLFSSYYDPATQGGSNPQYQQYLQNVSGTTGTPVSELNQTVLNQYNAAKNLAGVKPLYKKGIPLTANVGWDFIGNAFGDASSGPFTGYGSFNAGYAPEPGLYGTADLGMMGVFGRRKNNASIKPQRYFDKGLTRQGDMAFIPKLNILNVALRQRPEYNESQTQQILDAYAKDIEQGTTTAKDFITNKTDESKFDLSFLSPELTYQVKPFKDIPGILSATAGARLDYGGKDSSGNRIPIKPLPYGNVRYTVPIEGAIDKLKDRNLPSIKRKKTYNDYANDQEYDEEYTNDTPEEDTPTENNIEVNPPERQVNPNGTVLDRGDCPEGYERPCPKCRCEKIKMPQMYTDKRGTHLFGNESIRFQDGGEKEAMNAMMKARLAYANMFGNPSAQRMINIPDQPYEFDNGDMGTHYMASMDNYAVPQIQDENGQLMLGNYGPESREAIRFDSDEDANYFAENYKDVSPGFIDLELTEDEIEEYKKGGYIVEDISIPKLSMKRGGELPKAQPGQIVEGGAKALNALTKIDKLHIDDFANLSEIIKNSAFSYPLTIEAPSGFMKLIPNDPKNIDQNLWHFLADMPNQREAGKAFHMFNQILPPKPSLLETDSLSLDSLGTLLNMGKKKDWISEYENDVHLNSMSKNSDLFKGLAIPNTPYGLRDSLADQMVERLTKFIQSKGYDMDAYRANPPGITNQNKVYVPNYKLTRTWKLGGESNYELGDEIDEATMKQLKELGYTFEKI